MVTVPVGEPRWRGPRPIAVHKPLPLTLQRVSACVPAHPPRLRVGRARLRCLCQPALSQDKRLQSSIPKENQTRTTPHPSVCAARPCYTNKPHSQQSGVLRTVSQPINQKTKTCAACGTRQGCALPLLQLLQALLQAN